MKKNLLFILTDQHNPKVMGAGGNDIVQTSTLDGLANDGVSFANAYANCPLCCPSRAALATGRYPHQTGHWNNSSAYAGKPRSWHHRVRDDAHYRFDAIGKLHFRSANDDNGFSEEHNTLHVVAGTGDLAGNLRDDPSIFDKRAGVLNAGIGESSYTKYDAENAESAARWIGKQQGSTCPWALFLGIALPHPPNLVPAEYFERYAEQDLPRPPQWREPDWPDHPAIAYARKFYNFTEQVSEEVLQRFSAAYYGAVNYVDDQIHQVIEALKHSGSFENTTIVYASDHGEDLGARGLFGKFTMYDEAMRVPLVIVDPDLDAGKRVSTPVSLVDVYKTMIEWAGLSLSSEERDYPGESLFATASRPSENRTIFGEYHGGGTRKAVYMLRDAQFKYTHYVDQPPMLFDLANDPKEQNDLASSRKDLVASYEQQLRTIVDPEGVDQEARDFQRQQVVEAGGAAAVKQKGTFDNSPVPGEEAIFMTRD